MPVAEPGTRSLKEQINQLASDAGRRFVNWDEALFREVVADAGVELAASLHATGNPAAARALVIEWARLCVQGIGLGYLVPQKSGHLNPFTLLFTEKLPALLPNVAPARWSDRLATCWNLGENLESQPDWLRRLFHRQLRELDSLELLEDLVAKSSRDLTEAPTTKLTKVRAVRWLDLAPHVPGGLPGRLHFVAPRLLAAVDRLDGTAHGIWMAETPRYLGPLGKVELPPENPDDLGPLELEAEAQAIDARVEGIQAGARSPHFAALSLRTSQQIAVLLP